MRMFIYVYIVCLLMMISACRKDLPEPETKNSGKPISIHTVSLDIPVFKTSFSSNEPFFVNHKIEGRNVLIECIVQGITFRETDGNNKGKIILYVDGKKKEEILSAAFIVKGLSSGKHRLKLQVITENGSSILMEKEFNVTIR